MGFKSTCRFIFTTFEFFSFFLKMSDMRPTYIYEFCITAAFSILHFYMPSHKQCFYTNNNMKRRTVYYIFFEDKFERKKNKNCIPTLLTFPKSLYLSFSPSVTFLFRKVLHSFRQRVFPNIQYLPIFFHKFRERER